MKNAPKPYFRAINDSLWTTSLSTGNLAGGVTISIINFISKVPRLLKAGYHIHPLPAPVSDMITIEQRIKYYNLLYATIGNHVRGDVVELGYFTGECAILFQKVIEMNSSQKGLHLYDSCQSI